VYFSQRGAEDLAGAVRALAGGDEEIAFVGAGRPAANLLALVVLDDGIRVDAIWPGRDPLDLPGFTANGEQRMSTRDVDPEDAVAAAQMVIDARGARDARPVFIHLGR
jgi:hypothetical protein